jgi:hypothetical protein
MPTGFLIEVNVINKQVTGLYIRLPETAEERNAVALALVKHVAPGLQKADPESFALLEVIYAVGENLKLIFPELGADVRRQFIKSMKAKRDVKK